jgi:pectin methylesterase-like acyl-CoA thioesterase
MNSLSQLLGLWLCGGLLAACGAHGARSAAEGTLPGADGGGSPSGEGGSSSTGGGLSSGGGPSLSADGGTSAVDDAGGSMLAMTSGRFPAEGAKGVCADAPLRITFASPVTVGKTGKVQVFKASQPDMPVDTIDVAAASFSDTIVGRVFQQTRPVFIDGNDAVIYLHKKKLVPNETYFVTIDSGVFLDAAQNPLGAISGSSWTFSTSMPAPMPGTFVVAREGGGDYCTVQGAVDAIPAAGTTPVVITIKNGTYHEIVYISGKNNLTLRGEDRKKTILAYANNDTLQLKGGTKVRAMVEVENSNGLVVENLTLHNTTPQNGSQAEALRVEPGDQVILRNADFLSLQDTLLLSGRVYVQNSYIEGNVDYIWGKGTVYFDHCEIKTVGRAGYNVQARNPADKYGYVFVDSKLTADAALTGHILARIDVTPTTGYPASHVAYVNCQMDKFISPKGWLITPAGTTDTASVRFWEYQSIDPAGAPIDVSMRDPASKQLTDPEAMMMRDKSVVLGGWNPSP